MNIKTAFAQTINQNINQAMKQGLPPTDVIMILETTKLDVYQKMKDVESQSKIIAAPASLLVK